MRTDICKYEEGCFIVVKINKNKVFVTNVSVKVRSKTIVKITIEKKSEIPVQLHFSGRRGKFEDFLDFSVLYVCRFQFVSDGCQVWIYSVFFVIYIADYFQAVTFVTVIF